jgi:hypothetical protein
MKIMMNAEAFGFGPAAAIASIFKTLKNSELVSRLDYIGTGHTLDLQKRLDYDNIYLFENEFNFKTIVKDYDFFITALDFEKAKFANEVGVKTIIYDNLLWYWKCIPISLYNANAYIVQDFYGVKERIKLINMNNINLIPPSIVTPLKNDNKKIILINFGGLENPYWNVSVTIKYIRKILNSLLPLLAGHEIIITASKSHIQYLKEFDIKNLSFSEMQCVLSRTKYIIATPGLGNINEIANYNIPSLFLPPANDSQGQQLMILRNENLISNYIDWEDIGSSINYKDKQKIVLNNIENQINNLNHGLLKKLLKAKLFKDENLNLSKMINMFDAKENVLSDTIMEVITNNR